MDEPADELSGSDDLVERDVVGGIRVGHGREYAVPALPGDREKRTCEFAQVLISLSGVGLPSGLGRDRS
jgi:hypothetical protein